MATKKAAPRKRKQIKHYQLNAVELFDYLSIDHDQAEQIQFFAPLSKKQETFCNDQDNDIIVFGGQAGSGKTQVSILRMLMGVLEDPNYAACICRQSKVQLKGAGAIFPTATRVFEYAANASTNKIELSWNFPNGPELKAMHLDGNQNDYQGMQVTEFYVDESTQCKEADVVYLMSRLRSKAKRTHQLVLATNPLFESFLRIWLEKAGYLDTEGFCKPEMDGATTFMARIDGEWVFTTTWEEMAKMYGDDTADEAYRFVFYSAGVDDNPYIKRYLPDYIRKLDNLPMLERLMLRKGCWYAKPEASGFFKREWVKIVDQSHIPLHLKKVRAWDIAATLPDKEVNTNPDWTRGLLGCYDKESAIFYVLDMVSIRDRPARVQQLIEQTAIADGKNTYISLPLDPGAGAKESLALKQSRLGSMGFKTLVSRTQKSKFERAEGFLIAAQNGQVVLAAGDWNKAFLEEWEGFDGKSSRTKKDDIVDSCSDCHIQTTSNNLIPSVVFNKKRADTLGGATLV